MLTAVDIAAERRLHFADAYGRCERCQGERMPCAVTILLDALDAERARADSSVPTRKPRATPMTEAHKHLCPGCRNKIVRWALLFCFDCNVKLREAGNVQLVSGEHQYPVYDNALP